MVHAAWPTIDIIIPAHNEEESIGKVIEEFHQTVAVKGDQAVQFIICEDGSTDATVPVVRKLAERLPIQLLTFQERKGYSKAVIEGLRAAQSEVVGFIDGDGQCAPEDLFALRERISGCDMVMGWRNPRRDTWIRKLMSNSFGFVYRLFFNVRLKDPSCPYFLIQRAALDKILAGNVGILPQGFWWEFIARAHAVGLKIEEHPVQHRERMFGQTQVYRWKKIPRIAYVHLLGLLTLRSELNATNR